MREQICQAHRLGWQQRDQNEDELQLIFATNRKKAAGSRPFLLRRLKRQGEASFPRSTHKFRVNRPLPHAPQFHPYVPASP
jgi:hypothetical protein